LAPVAGSLFLLSAFVSALAEAFGVTAVFYNAGELAAEFYWGALEC
jgi:hypothetical protein